MTAGTKELHYLSLSDVAERLRTGLLSSSEVTAHALRRIETLEPRLHAFSQVRASEALKEAQLADAVDVFCESIAFTLEQTEQIFRSAKALGLPIKCHAEQLSNLGASALAAQLDALSCDHLEFLDALGASAMAKAKTVAVLLPGAYYFLREKHLPPIDLLRAEGVGIAIATDSNPGSSPTTSLLLMMSMACQFFSLTVDEVLSAVTFQAARALGIDDEVGSIAVGNVADLVLWSVHDAATLCYYFAYPLTHKTMIAGEWLSPAKPEFIKTVWGN